MQPLVMPLYTDLTSILDGEVLVRLHEDWTLASGRVRFPPGSIVSMHLDDVLHDPAHLHPTLVYAPTQEEFMTGYATTASHLIVTTLNHVQGGAYSYTHSKGGWQRTLLIPQKNATVAIESTDNSTDIVALYSSGFITPPSIIMGDAGTATTMHVAKSDPALFDTAQLTVEQLTAKSNDGTVVPYFIVHSKNIRYDGTNPTLLYAYGGFEVPQTPFYSATMGKLWLERGGVYALANIRDGGEFGPAWHDQTLKL